MNASYFILIIVFTLSFLFSWWLTPYIICWHRRKNILCEDMNKFKKPRVVGLGGLVTVIAFFLSVTMTVLIKIIWGVDHLDLSALMFGVLTIMFIAFLGFVDDVLMFPIRPIKPILSFFASIPMVALAYEMSGPNITSIESALTLLFPLVLVPLMVIFSSNAINIMADFDGLVPGNGIIISSALFIVAWMSGDYTVMFILGALLGGLLTLYYYNRYPAKLFTGNVGTLFIGSIFAVVAIIGHLKLAFLILMIPYLLHFILQERMVFEKNDLLARPRERGILQPDGTLRSEYKKSFGLTHFIMLHCKKVTEKRLTSWIMLFECLAGVAAIAIHYIRLS